MISIIISEYNSLPWLRLAVHQIRKHTHIPYHIYISQQGTHPVAEEYNGWKFITVVKNPPSSSGAGTDYILKNCDINTKYICSMDVDTFPISDDWLTAPIKLLEDFGLTWVGLRAHIEHAYGLNYFHMGECYRVGRTEHFKLLSRSAGWYQRKGTPFFDNAVCAHSWEDANHKHTKLSLPVTARLGLTLTEGEYGRVIGNLAVHFCLAYTGTLHARRVKNLGTEYISWEDRLTSLPPDEFVTQFMNALHYSDSLQPLQYWDGEKIAPCPAEIEESTRYFCHRKGNMAPPLHHVIRKYGLNIRGVVHIGAHFGQEYADYHDNGIKNIIMVEPLPSAYAEMVKRMPDEVICYKLALGNGNGVVVLNTETANEGMSSSILKPDLHLKQYPHIEFNGTEIVNMTRLDDLLTDSAPYNMLNIDVQGYELEVLKGAVKTLKGIDIIWVEVNRAPLYVGAPHVDDIDRFLTGFNRVETEWIGDTWGEAIYIRK